MTATEVARNLSAVLDEAEHGGTITVTRGGRRIATIMPARTVRRSLRSSLGARRSKDSARTSKPPARFSSTE
ncbi:type II toxin-antitoxin system Phd/YefM family antitoxin [Nocardia otitidiscaviarum]|uniref:type II toxin-antitoxin system Phd/YefM family antitoxin n=1 Tax=Nocardia otitidiscaviarum TaxID=1823 RepID=UPI001E57A7EC|nr:type II toxin-antitoxin system prevent-host-death family antitoxin [Nocardia otitidiscaviarum]